MSVAGLEHSSGVVSNHGPPIQKVFEGLPSLTVNNFICHEAAPIVKTMNFEWQ